MIRISSLFFVFALFAMSCKKSTDTAPHKNAFSASVNGSAFVPTGIEVLVSGSSIPGARAVNVYANEGNGHQLYLNMYDYDGTKTAFNLVDVNQSGNAFGSFGSYCSKNCGSFSAELSVSETGGINITSFDKKTYNEGEVITGTFQFETNDSTTKYSVTNGHFSLQVPN